ncbi:hypothetical protein [Streptomyces sp. NPDC058268]|uniref:hypothetical protein n=1 Tax=Streptomyces sp. NPDC058268 TaxID=3346413 RepID=UPI0036EA9CBB
MFILTGASPRTLAHRIEDLQAMTAEHPAAAQLAQSGGISLGLASSIAGAAGYVLAPAVSFLGDFVPGLS